MEDMQKELGENVMTDLQYDENGYVIEELASRMDKDRNVTFSNGVTLGFASHACVLANYEFQKKQYEEYLRNEGEKKEEPIRKPFGISLLNLFRREEQ